MVSALVAGWQLRCIVQKSGPSLNDNGDNKTKKFSILFGSRLLGRDPRAAFFSGAVLKGTVLRQFYAGGKISASCLANRYGQDISLTLTNVSALTDPDFQIANILSTNIDLSPWLGNLAGVCGTEVPHGGPGAEPW